MCGCLGFVLVESLELALPKNHDTWHVTAKAVDDWWLNIDNLASQMWLMSDRQMTNTTARCEAGAKQAHGYGTG